VQQSILCVVKMNSSRRLKAVEAVSDRIRRSPSARRRLVAATAVDWIGTGLFVAAAPAFLLETIGLSQAAIGAGLTIAGAAGMVTSVPIGVLGDRFGPRRVLVGLHLARSAEFAAYPFVVHGEVSFVLLTAAIVAADTATPSVTQSVVAELADERQRVRLMAVLRTTLNVGMSLGALGAALALTRLTSTTFTALLLVNAVTFLGAAVLVASASVGEPARAVVRPASSGRAWWEALRLPRRLLAFGALDGVMTLYLVVLNVALPLWVVAHTAAPAGLIGLLYTLNTALVVVLQVPGSRLAETLRASARTEVLAGAALAASSVVIGITDAVSAGTAVVLLVAGILLLTLGEIGHSAASWQISYSLSGDVGRTRALAVYGLGRSAAYVAGPLLLTVGVVENGTAGWLGLSAAFVAASALIRLGLGRLVRPGPNVGGAALAEPPRRF
jgi:MFS family permease